MSGSSATVGSSLIASTKLARPLSLSRPPPICTTPRIALQTGAELRGALVRPALGDGLFELLGRLREVGHEVVLLHGLLLKCLGGTLGFAFCTSVGRRDEDRKTGCERDGDGEERAQRRRFEGAHKAVHYTGFGFLGFRKRVRDRELPVTVTSRSSPRLSSRVGNGRFRAANTAIRRAASRLVPTRARAFRRLRPRATVRALSRRATGRCPRSG